jgi:hypothetical protein
MTMRRSMNIDEQNYGGEHFASFISPDIGGFFASAN